MALTQPFNKTIIGMIHVPALPGTPQATLSMAEIIARVTIEARIYQEAGVDMVAIENMHDVPYCNQHVGPEIIAAMTVVGSAVKQACQLPCGIQILAGANKAALAVAHTVGLDFVRAEGFVFAHVADEGLINGQAAELLRYRKQIGAEHIPILTDIKKKHSSHALTADVDIAETAHAAEFFLSDGVIVTGTATGVSAATQEVKIVKETVNIPVLVGSGITIDNLMAYLTVADGLIVGSYFKEGGDWRNPLSKGRVQNFMQAVWALREEFSI